MQEHFYTGRRTKAGSWVVTCDGKILSPTRSQTVRNHSPDGFAWGYEGSGPAQLALALLLNEGYCEAHAGEMYQRFKSEVIATLPDEWQLTSFQIATWVSSYIVNHE